ncbi:MAG: hypothetical protein A3I73_01135 [Omnitrophica bacterium RIFCSPLOWO2_02_FULL_45_16]|nr:MAG: hypothetical protein A3I73_01135 [Omnitrophica bacterium RIFCSPLOWO2_02_FULL_45_16]
MDSAEGHGRCTKRLAQNVRKNAKFLSSPAETAQYTAGTASQSVKKKDAKRRFCNKQGTVLLNNQKSRSFFILCHADSGPFIPVYPRQGYMR